MAVKAGSILYCPKCDAEIAELLVDIKRGDWISSSLFKGITRKMVKYEKMICNCGQSYYPLKSEYFKPKKENQE